MAERAVEQTITTASTECTACGLVFWVPRAWLAARRNDHATFYCPNGHPRYFPGESETEELRRELDKEKERRRWAEESAKSAERSRAATLGEMTKLKKRVAAGVCPCCNRSFQNLQRHMATKHPEEVTRG